MKNYSGITIVSLLMMMAVNVTAGPMVFTDIFDAEREKITLWEKVSWEFDIKEDGFDPVSMEVTEASIELALEDDDQDLWILPSEFAFLSVGEAEFFLWEVDTENYTFEVSSLLTLNEEGTIAASLRSLQGDFYFNSATLTAHATPEPNALSLIGFGLIGFLGFSFRRKMN